MKEFKMIDKKKVFKKDLSALEAFIEKRHNEVELPKKIEWTNKLKNNAFEEVVQELFRKDEILQFLETTTLSSIDVTETNYMLIHNIIVKIDTYKDKSADSEIMQKFGNLILQHVKITGKDDVSDPVTLKYLLEWFDDARYHNELIISPSRQMRDIDNNYSITDLCFETNKEIKFTINKDSFSIWFAHYSSMKDKTHDTAEVKLVDYKMTNNKKSLEDDLQSLKAFITNSHNTIELPKKMGWTTKLTNNKFEEVVRELFSSEKLSKFLERTGLCTGKEYDTSELISKVTYARNTLLSIIIGKIDGYKDKSNELDIMEKFGNIILKHAKIPGENDMSDPTTLKYLLKWLDDAMYDGEHNIPSSSQMSGVGKKYSIIDLCFGNRTEIKLKINEDSFSKWIGGYFSIKINPDNQNKAEFVLDY